MTLTTFKPGADGFPTIPKDPLEGLDYIFDWTNGGVDPWLATGETIASFDVTADSGVLFNIPDVPADPALINTATAVKVWIGGGIAGKSYKVSCYIVTNVGRKSRRTMGIDCTRR